MDTLTKNIKEKYALLLSQQYIEVSEIDYDLFEKQKQYLQKLADIGHSGISVFDLHQKKHIFNSSNLGIALGYNQRDFTKETTHFWDKKIHPANYIQLMQNALLIVKLFFKFTADEKLNHKLVCEYRILNASNKFVWVIEQQQVVSLDYKNNL